MVEKVEELHWVREKHPILGWPLIRGVVVFLDSMVKGMQALTYSACLLYTSQLPVKYSGHMHLCFVFCHRQLSSIHENSQTEGVGNEVPLT